MFFKNRCIRKVFKMKNKLILVLLALSVFTGFFACSKAGGGGSGEKSLNETYWLQTIVIPSSILGDRTVYSGLAFSEKNTAEKLSLTEFLRLKTENVEYEYKRGEGFFYPGTKKDYVEEFNQGKTAAKQLGINMTDKEIKDSLIKKFTVSGEELTLDGANTAYKKVSLEELQKVFKDYKK